MLEIMESAKIQDAKSMLTKERQSIVTFTIAKERKDQRTLRINFNKFGRLIGKLVQSLLILLLGKEMSWVQIQV